MAAAVHRYHARVAWTGSTGAGYDHYTRAHEATCPPATQHGTATSLPLSSDPAFKGDPARLNPEQLLVLAASSCQLLSFLAVAARARIDVTAYEDDAEGVMPEDDPPMRVTRITLRPRIAIAGELPDLDRLHRLVHTAHRHCFIANTLITEICVEPTFESVPTGGATPLSRLATMGAPTTSERRERDTDDEGHRATHRDVRPRDRRTRSPHQGRRGA